MLLLGALVLQQIILESTEDRIKDLGIVRLRPTAGLPDTEEQTEPQYRPPSPAR